MKIAYVLADPGIGIFGTKGASVHAQEIIRALRQLGHEVTVFCTKRGNKHGEPETEFVPGDLRDLPVFVVPVAGVKGAAAREQAVLRTSHRMADLVIEGGFDLIYERYSLFSTAGATATRQTGAPLIVEVNSPLLAEQSTHRSLHDSDTAMQTTLQTFAAAALLSCVSTPVADWVRCLIAPDSSSGTPQIQVSPNGVNTQRFSPRPVSETTDDAENSPFTVGFLGTLKPWHGTETLLEAFASAPATGRNSWRCEILGDGPQRQQLEDLAAPLGIRDQIIFHGAATPEEVPQVLSRWDVGVAPYPATQQSSTHYFSPLKIYEYLAAGLPVIASEVGEIPSVIDHGRTGLLVPGSDTGSLAAALAQLAGDRQRRQSMGAAARAEAEQKHSWLARTTDILRAAGLPAPLAAQEVAT